LRRIDRNEYATRATTAGQNPPVQMMAKIASRPMEGIACPMLAMLTRGADTRRANGRVSSIPTLTASTTTITVETAASWTCSISRAVITFALMLRRSILSSSLLLMYR
jgi:hypothetical protein